MIKDMFTRESYFLFEKIKVRFISSLNNQKKYIFIFYEAIISRISIVLKHYNNDTILL